MPPLPDNDTDVYIVIADFGTNGRSFLETDVTQADRATIVSNMISGEYRDPLRVVAFNTGEGWSRDVSEEIAYDVLDRAYDADTALSAGAKRFIDRHFDDQRRPRSPSVLGDADIVRKKLAWSVPGNREITVSITSLSDAELISILQYEDLDDGMTQFVEAEIARRKKEGTPNNWRA
jgi:hypothetical protein